MYQTYSNPSIREGDEITTEWSKISYDRWCADNHLSFRTVPGIRIISLYDVVDSVIENDLSETEKSAIMLHFFEGYTIKRTAHEMNTSYSNAHAALKRAEKKLTLVLKHIINCEEYKTQDTDP
ncbi:MAG: hypothetical protein J6B25_10640 [Clostridia bacterium]|nr:hypothetical protein [Clostridia bacterium]